jgi:hypothetical protein
MTIARTDITTELLREAATQCALQTALGETLPTLNKAFIKLVMRKRPVTWVLLSHLTV